MTHAYCAEEPSGPFGSTTTNQAIVTGFLAAGRLALGTRWRDT